MSRQLVLIRLLVLFLFISVGLSLLAPEWVRGQPAAPTPLKPAVGDCIITPTFSWLSASGAVTYEVQVGPQSDPNLEYWSDETFNLVLTPVNAAAFPNEPLYWRVRGLEGDGTPGTWSERVNFDKIIPPPPQASPPNHAGLAVPSMSWQPIQGAVTYKVELSTDPTFNMVDESYRTYNTSLTPEDAIEHQTFFWRVTGIDSDGHEGTPSVARFFVKRIPAPILLSPVENSTAYQPTFSWQVAAGATSYKVELSNDSTFNSIDHTYTTYNLSLTPLDAIAPEIWYWRVRGVDARSHDGTPSAPWSFTKAIAGPQPVAPADGATVTIPSLTWSPAKGAAYYRVEVTTDPDFVGVDETYTTYNTSLTPEDALDTGTYFWRVRGVDEEAHVGEPGPIFGFVLEAPAAATNTTVALQLPAGGATLTSDPTFRWGRVSGASSYRIKVSTEADMDPVYDKLDRLEYSSYTPYKPGFWDAYANGVYYWQIEAKDNTGAVFATSQVRQFIKALSLPLAEPVDGAGLSGDPEYTWERVVGADFYRLLVSAEPDFNSTYDRVDTLDHTAYTSYTPGFKDAYQNGTYYWKIEARDSTGTVIAGSQARHFSKAVTITLDYPVDGASLSTDPIFRWRPVVGAEYYRLLVCTDPGMSNVYDRLDSLDYPAYTPYVPGFKDAYANGAYYWHVEARDHVGTVIVTSAVRQFTKQVSVPLVIPPDDAMLGGTPMFQWAPLVGAQSYRFTVSTQPNFNSTYDKVDSIEYTSYTPYGPGFKDEYENGTYYWKIEARDKSGTVFATSLTRTFTLSGTQPTSTPIGAPTFTPRPTATATPIPPATATPGPSPTPPGANPTAFPPPANQKTMGNVTVYADTYTDLGDDRWQASGKIRLGSATVATVELSAGTVTLDYGAVSIEGSSESVVGLLMDDDSTSPVFSGSFAVSSSSGLLTPMSVSYRLARLGDLGVDVSTPISNFTMNVLEGTATGTARVSIYPIEGVMPSARVAFTLHTTGEIDGSLGINDLSFSVAALTFAIKSASFGYNPTNGGAFTIDEASVALPPAFSIGLTAEGSVSGLVITEDGLSDITGGSITLSLPDMAVPGTGGKFELAGAAVTMSVAAGGKYMVHGRADFSLPNIASSGKTGQTYSGALYAEFELDQEGLRYVLMGGTVEPGIPIGQSGMALTGMEGRVTLRPEVRVQITGTIESQLEIPFLGPVISGEPSVWVQLSHPYEVGVSGSVQVLIFDAASASLVISQRDGVTGEAHISYPPYALEGDAYLHVWREGDSFHFTGSAGVRLGFEKGDWYQKCWQICLFGCYTACLSVPPVDLVLAQVDCEFGEFCENQACSSSIYGLKGRVSALNGHWNKTFFIDSSGDLCYGDDAEQYALYDQSDGRTQTMVNGEPYTDTYPVAVGITDQALFMLGWVQGDPSFSLVNPNGNRVKPGVDVGIYYTQVLTNAYIVVSDPISGTWQAEVGNLEGDEYYVLNVLGSNVPPQVEVGKVTEIGENRFTIEWKAVDPDDTPTLALYYDSDGEGSDGRLIAQGLDPSTASYDWNGSQVPSGDYYVYARIDDLRNTPAIDYAEEPVSVVNTEPPVAPTGLSGDVPAPWTSLTACWDRNPEVDVVGYRVYYGRESGNYDLGIYDATNLTCINLPVHPRIDTYFLAVLAYDSSGNEGPLSAEWEVAVERSYLLYLPLVLRSGG